MSTDPQPARPELRELGAVYVTLRAAEEYAAREKVDVDRARRELTAILGKATLREPATEGQPALYRFRSRGVGLDIAVRVEREVPLPEDAPEAVLAVVVHVTVREYNSPGGGKHHR